MLSSIATGIGHRFSSMAAEFRPLVRFTRVLRLHVLVLEQTPLQLPLVVAVVVLLVVETQLTANFPFSGILLGFIAGSLGIILTNGGIGTYPILVGIVVAFYIGKDYPEHAFAICTALGWIIWLSQTLLMIVLGLISLILTPNNFTKEHE